MSLHGWRSSAAWMLALAVAFGAGSYALYAADAGGPRRGARGVRRGAPRGIVAPGNPGSPDGGAAVAGPASTSTDLREADRYYAEKSYRLARETYDRWLALPGSREDARYREIRFKAADSLWREGGPSQLIEPTAGTPIGAEAPPPDADVASSKIAAGGFAGPASDMIIMPRPPRDENRPRTNWDKAADDLKLLIAEKPNDRWWAEANRSAAELYLQWDSYQHFMEIEKWLVSAIGYWGQAPDGDYAREQYVFINMLLGDTISNSYGWLPFSGSVRPVEREPYIEALTILPPWPPRPPERPEDKVSFDVDRAKWAFDNVVRRATDDNKKAEALVKLATRAQQLEHQAREKPEEMIDKALAYAKRVIDELGSTDQLDDALMKSAEILNQKQDYVAAAAQYRTLTQRFQRAQSPFYDQAISQLRDITQPQLTLYSSQAFTPGSYVQLTLNYRNLEEVELALWKLKPLDIVNTSRIDYWQNYFNTVQLERFGTKIKTWKVDKIENDGKHIPHGQATTLDPLEPGLYVVAATSDFLNTQRNGRSQTRASFLVTELSLTVKTGKKNLYVFAANAATGEPEQDTTIKILDQYTVPGGRGGRGGMQQRTRIIEGKTDKDGLANIEIKPVSENPEQYGNENHQYFGVAMKGESPAFAGNLYWNFMARDPKQLMVYAYSDRPAYRPKETIHFKAILRDYQGWAYEMPERKEWIVRISDAQGAQVYDKPLKVNEYGSIEGSFDLGEEPKLGVYSIAFVDPTNQNQVGGAPLCRVEEYKLPEFKVSIATSDKAYRLGDTMKIDVKADYYFGGAVGDAEVTVVAKSRPYQHWWEWPRPYPWYYENTGMMRGGGRTWPGMYRGQEKIVKEVTLRTDAEGKASFEIETPKDSTTDLSYTIEARVVDKSRREIRSTQELNVTKKAYFAYLKPENWVYRPGDTATIKVETKNANNEPVAQAASLKIYRLKWSDTQVVIQGATRPRGYEREEISTRSFATDEDGAAEFEWQPGQSGYYEIEWEGKDKFGETVTSSTTVWVAEPGVKDIGYRYGGVRIVADKETYHIGDTARLLITSFVPHGWVLFSIESEDIYEMRVVELDGPVQMIEVPIKAEHEPNVFLLAAMHNQFQIFMDQQQIIVPPVENFIDVKISPDKERYQPGETGTVAVQTVDSKGQPVSTEISLGVVDASVYYIQSDLAQDIRQQFYGQIKGLNVNTQHSQSTFRFEKFVKNDKGEIVSANLYEGLEWMNQSLRELSKDKAESDSDRGDMRVGNEAMPISGPGGRGGGMAMDSMSAAASPMAPAPMMAGRAMMKSSANFAGGAEMAMADGAMGGDMNEEAQQLARAVVRTDFRSTVLWQPTVVTDANGKATVEVKYPDSVTEWKAKARAIDKKTRVGVGEESTRTKKDIMVRLQAPRFFVEGDEAVLSAIVNNYTDTDQVAVVQIDAGEMDLMKPDGAVSSAEPISTEPVLSNNLKISIGVRKDGERRVDWRFKVNKQGETAIRATAQTREVSDAMEKKYPVFEHGIEKFVASAGKMPAQSSAAGGKLATFSMDLPEKRKAETDRLQLNLTPSLAGALVGSLDYLADYPYGCVEQTLSRFVPTVIVAQTLKDLNLSRPELEKKLPDMTEAGIKRLADFQHADGGWAWWKEGDSDPFMTAYVVYGLTLAQRAGVSVPRQLIDGGIRCLNENIIKFQDQPDMIAWCTHALSYHDGALGPEATRLLETAWVDRAKLNPYTRALMLIAYTNLKDTEKKQILVDNMRNGLEFDADTQTAHWGQAGICYRWSDGGIEATAFALKALLMADPQNPLIDQAMLWLVRNRRGQQWKNTRDTAIATYALADYIKARGEGKADYDAVITVNGKKAGDFHVDPDNVFDSKIAIDVPREWLTAGKNEIKIEKTGDGPLYYSAYITYFTMEDEIASAGNEIFVERNYFKLTDTPSVDGAIKVVRSPLKEGDALQSGDRVDVVLSIDAKNHYSYLVFEDLKAAGLEPVDIQSGYDYKNGLGVYREFRDEKTAMFVSEMKQGKYELSYTLRAEVPGKFTALPTLAHAMYVPEIRANSADFDFDIEDK